VRDDKLLIWRRARRWEHGRELGEAEGGVDGGHVGVVGEVKVESLVEGEGDGVVVESDIVLSGS